MRDDERRILTVREAIDWRPQAVFVPGNWVPHYFPGLKVEVFHGFSVGKRIESREHFRIRGSFDLYCTQGPDTTGPFMEIAREQGYFRIIETGWPKLDPLFSGPYSVTRDAAMRTARPVVMYASTFTESISSARTLCDTIARLAAKGPWQWLVTLHPMMAPDVIASYQALEGSNLRFVMNDDILSLYAQADVLLSDTSSVVPEFLVIGGLAVNMHGYSRDTADLDLLVRQESRDEWLKLFSELGYTLFSDRAVFCQLDPPQKGTWPVDLMLVRESTFREFLNFGMTVEMFGERLLIPTLEHLIALKLHALKHGRIDRYLKDYLDVEGLVRINKIDLHQEKVRELFLKYGTLDVYEKISRTSAQE